MSYLNEFTWEYIYNESADKLFSGSFNDFLPRGVFLFRSLSKGVFILSRYIQEHLGHSCTKTTEIYTHVTEKSLTNIKSPLDKLM